MLVLLKLSTNDVFLRSWRASRVTITEQRYLRLQEASLSQEVQFLAARARSVGSSKANVLLSQLGLKVRSYSVLSLACSGLQPTQRELGEFLLLDPSQIVALVDELESKGLVNREVDPTDRRSKIITATEKGQQLYSQAYDFVMTAEEDSLATLSKREKAQLRSILQKIAF